MDGAVRYDLRAYTHAGGWEFLGGDNLTATGFDHTGLTVGRDYYYWVRAFDADGRPGYWTERTPATVTSAHTPAPTPTPTLTPTPTPSPALTPTPTPARSGSGRVSQPPGALRTHPYYQKYLDVDGVPVLAPSSVTDEELYQVRDTMLAMLSDRQDIHDTMVQHGFRILIYADRFEKGGRITDIPEFSEVGFSESVAGAAGRTIYGWVAGAPETARHCNDVFIHEYAHLVEDALRLQPGGGEEFLARLQSAYRTAILRGRWEDAYAGTSFLEYWAEVVRFWFTPSHFAGLYGSQYQTLAQFDPIAAALVADVFGNPAPLTFCAIRRFDVRGMVNVPGGQSAQPETYVLQLSLRSPSGGKRLVGAGAAVRRSDGTFAFERLPVEKVFLAASGEKPYIHIGIYRQNDASNPECPAAAFIGHDGSLIKSADPAHWKRFRVTGNDIAGINITIPPGFDWTPLHQCI